MTQYVIVAELPEPLRSALARLRQEIDVWSKSWLPPHVTIVRPLALDLSTEMKNEIRRPISLTSHLIRWATFRNPGRNGLYLEPTSEPFRRLRDDLFLRVPALARGDRSVDPYQKFSRHPKYHVTIAASVPDDEIDRVYAQVNKKEYPQPFTIGEPSLYSWNTSGFWELQR